MTQPQADPSPEQNSEADPQTDFVLNVYKGCVLPEDYKPIQCTSWNRWVQDNPDDYSPDQLELIRQRLLAGRSWVCFVARLETISAPEHYINREPYCNPIRPKDRLV